MVKLKKVERLEKLNKIIKKDPFLTDEELSEKLGVSIQTIRLDRLKLNIPELRERMKNVATGNYDSVRKIEKGDLVGELIDLEVNKRAISILNTEKTMSSTTSEMVRGYYIYAMAESLAMAVINEPVSITSVANIKYKVPVKPEQKVIAKAQVNKIKGVDYYVHVMINSNDDQVFRGKFIISKIVL
jgi:acyl-coenzyme A thioesterase PaaI-like protein